MSPLTVRPIETYTSASDQTPAPAQGSGGASQLDYNAFLKLLIAQLKNQDPTNPTDGTQFVAQLATFSQVEQGIATNKKLESLLTSQSLTLADAVIGHTVTSADGKTKGVVTSVTITSDGPVATLADGSTITLGDGIKIE